MITLFINLGLPLQYNLVDNIFLGVLSKQEQYIKHTLNKLKYISSEKLIYIKLLSTALHDKLHTMFINNNNTYHVDILRVHVVIMKFVMLSQC